MHEFLAALGKSIASLLIGIAAIIHPPVPQYTTTFPVVASTSLSDLPAPPKDKTGVTLQQAASAKQVKTIVSDPVPVQPDPYQSAWDALNADIQHGQDLEKRDQEIINDWGSGQEEQAKENKAYDDKKAQVKAEILSEVQAAGGYITPSQLDAMATARIGN